MPANGLSLGIDYNFGLYDTNTAQLIDLGDVQNVKITALYHDVSSRPYNKQPKFAHIPDGFKGSFTTTRTSGSLENLQITLNQAFQSGSVMKPGYLNETVNEADGTVSRYQYIGCDFKITEIADVSREKVVTQHIEFMASDKIKVA